MTEATRGEGAISPGIDWRMSASLENVPRGDTDPAEVTNLAGEVRTWSGLGAEHRSVAVLTTERPVTIDGAMVDTFDGDVIAGLAERVPAADADNAD